MQKPSDSTQVVRSVGLTACVVLWLSVQLLVLLGAALQLPLADQFPRPAEQMALDEMLVVQIALSAMLFPMLARTPGSTLAVIATSWPALHLAGIMAAADAMRVFWAGCFVSLWILTLGLWAMVLKGRKPLLTGVAVSTALAVAGPVGWYLRAEFGATGFAAQGWLVDSRLGPVMGALAIAHGQAGSAEVWVPMGGVLAISAAVVGVKKRGLARRLKRVVGESGRD